jgi:hypothetical protein
MIRLHYFLPLAIIALITGAALVWQANPVPPESAKSAGSQLKVSSQGSIMNTNVQAGRLQPAVPPENSATSSQTNPQPAVPNYCLPGEQPVVDGCIAQ